MKNFVKIAFFIVLMSGCVASDIKYEDNDYLDVKYSSKDSYEIKYLDYDYVGDFNDGLSRVKKGDKYGFINKDGLEIIPCKYTYAEDFYDGIAAVSTEKVEKLQSRTYYTLDEDNHNSTYFLSGDLKYINTAGFDIVLVKTYDKILYKFEYDVFLACKMENEIEKWGILDKNGKEIIPCEYEEIQFTKDYFFIRNGLEKEYIDGKKVYQETWGLFDKDGNMILPIKYYDIEKKSENLFSVRYKCEIDDCSFGSYALFNEKGEKLSPFKYSDLSIFKEDMMSTINCEGKAGFIGKNGKEAIDFKYDYASYFSEGFAMVNKGGSYYEGGLEGGLWTYIDKNGKELFPFIYDEVQEFSESLAVVTKYDENNKDDEKNKIVSIIDKTGKVYYSYKGDIDISNFRNGIAEVSYDGFFGLKGYINKNGKKIILPRYDFIGGRNDYLIKVFKGGQMSENLCRWINGKAGLVNNKGKEIISCNYDDFEFEEEIIRTYKGGKFNYYDGKWSGGKIGVLDKKGKKIIKCKYDYVGDFSDGLISIGVLENEKMKYTYIYYIFKSLNY